MEGRILLHFVACPNCGFRMSVEEPRKINGRYLVLIPRDCPACAVGIPDGAFDSYRPTWGSGSHRARYVLVGRF